MATFTPSAPVETLRQGGGVRPPRRPSGGGDDGRGSSGASYPARLRRARLGIFCTLATVTMIFISLTSAYIVRKGLPTYDEPSQSYLHDWGQIEMPWGLLGINTALLLVSSCTMELARRNLARQMALAPAAAIPGVSLGKERQFPWLGLTLLLGFGFLAGQWMAWRELYNRGYYIATSPHSSFTFLLTAAHAVHLAGGILVLAWAAGTSLLKKPVESRRIVVDITAWYWHFMAFLWLYVFALLRFAQ